MDKLEEIFKMQYELNCKVGVDTALPNKIEWLFPYSTALSQEASELLDCSHWKWWSLDVKSDPSLMFKGIRDKGNAKIEAIDILHFLVSIFQILDMTPDDVMDVYRKKHQTNINRQDKGYDIETKNEKDNEEIIRVIS